MCVDNRYYETDNIKISIHQNNKDNQSTLGNYIVFFIKYKFVNIYGKNQLTWMTQNDIE